MLHIEEVTARQSNNTDDMRVYGEPENRVLGENRVGGKGEGING
jgi:hypothetical protein